MRFSLIVPIYNVKPYLNKCLDSILAQTYPDFEAILVDDGSTDGCAEICDAYAARDKRFKVIHKKNGGLVSARNAGLLAAQGDYVSYVDGDDWTKPDMLRFVDEQLCAAPRALDMVMFAADEVYTDHMGATLNKLPEGYYDKSRLEKELYPYLITDRRKGFRFGDTVHAHTWNKVCRRQLQLAHYVREERIRMLTDLPLIYECILDSDFVYICNERLYCYNKTNEQSIRAKSKENFIVMSIYYLVSYMQQRLRGVSPTIDRQLNDLPAIYVIRAAMSKLEAGKPLAEATREVAHSLEETQLLDLISLDGLPSNARRFISLLKKKLYLPAMLLCAAKVQKEKA